MAKSISIDRALLTAIISLALLSACAGKSDSSQRSDKKAADSRSARAALPTEDARRIATAHNSVGFDLLRQSSTPAAGHEVGDRIPRIEARPAENILISPLSIALALDMTLNGAAGETRDLILRALHLTDVEAVINAGDHELDSYLKSTTARTVLKIANALWANKEVQLKPAFVAANQKYFDARLETLDFKNPGAVGVINNWVKAETSDRIPSIIDATSGDALLYLTNATYFKGLWSEPFNRDETAHGDFMRDGGRPVRVRHMLRQGEMNYLDGDGFQAVRLPYDDSRTDLCVFLPARGKDLSAFVEALNADTWSTWQRKFQPLPGTLKLPRFKVAFKSELKDWLSALGMAVAFDPDRADFTAMSDVRAYISKVIHRTVMEVDEEGTVAAAATGAVIFIGTIGNPAE